mgnify:CR=1 FL=1
MNMTLEEAQRQVGPGWAGLVEAIYNRLPQDAHIDQIKEKFGGLRFYVDGDAELLDFIDEMEAKSLTVCEGCGKPGRPRDGGWILTLCDECAKPKG